ELAARHAAGWLARVARIARLRGLARIGEKTALLRTMDALLGPEPLENEFGGAGLQGGVVLRADSEGFDMVEQALDCFQLRECFVAGGVLRNLQFAAHFEPLHHGLEIHFRKVPAKRLSHGRANQFAGDIIGAAQLAFIFQLEFAGHRRNGGVDIGDARDGRGIAAADGALLGAAEHVFDRADRQALAYAGAAVNSLILARLKGDLLDDFADVIGDFGAALGVALRPRLLAGDRHRLGNGGGIVRANLRADAVFEGRDDLAARRVVLGVRGEDQEDVERQAHGIALNLHVAFLHDVEEADLYFAGEIGQFVEGENSAIRAGQQAVVDG